MRPPAEKKPIFRGAPNEAPRRHVTGDAASGMGRASGTLDGSGASAFGGAQDGLGAMWLACGAYGANCVRVKEGVAAGLR